MLLEKDIKKLFQQLIHDEPVHVQVNGSDFLVRIFDNSSKLFISTPVFKGGNFIPQSVRNVLNKKVPFQRDDQIKTYLTVDDNRYQVHLNYIGKVEDAVKSELFKDLLEEFSWLAAQWIEFLDEHGKQDLIHVRVK